MKVTRRALAVPDLESRRRADARIEWLRAYGETRINSRLIDRRRTIPPYVVLDFASHGLFGMQVEEKYGGLALRNRDVARVLEQAAAIDLSLGTFLLTSLFPGVRPIAAFGSPSLRDEILPDLAAGRVLAGYAQTEPAAGTHFPAMQARAVRRGEGAWAVSGDKIWIGNASWAGVLTVMAHDQEADGRRRGLTAFALRTDRPGVFLGAELLSLGMRGMVQNEVAFRDVEVDLEHVVGAPERGLEVGVDSMSFSRFAIAATCVGSMKRCTQLMLRYAARRDIATGRLLEHPVTRGALGAAVARIAAAEALLYRAASALDDGDGASAELFAVCKLVASEFLWTTADATVQLLGSRGYDEESGAPQLLRDARVTRIFEGASEALVGFVGGQALNPRSELYRMLREDLAAAPLADRLADAVTDMRERRHAGAPLPRPWQLALSGQAATWALVTGALHAEAERVPVALREGVGAWAEARFADAVARAARGGDDTAALVASEALREAVDAYAGSIGDVEQTLPGERLGLDPLLRRTRPDA